MKETFASCCIDYLKRNNACQKSEEAKFKYVLESLYSFFTKMLVILLLSLLIGTFKITLAMTFIYSVLRGFSYGIHASKNLYCWIISISVYVICPLIIKYIPLHFIIIYVLYIIGLLGILFWSPADTPARPLINKRKRITNKCISFCLMSFLIIVAIILKNTMLQSIIAFVLLINMICTNPLTYKIFKVPYNNYKNYKA